MSKNKMPCKYPDCFNCDKPDCILGDGRVMETKTIINQEAKDAVSCDECACLFTVSNKTERYRLCACTNYIIPFGTVGKYCERYNL